MYMVRLVHSHYRRVADSLWLITTRHGSFGTPLGLVLARDGGELRFRRLAADSTVVTAPYPAWAARTDGALCLPTTLALADEISTYAGFALWDERHRPGVSISLSGQLVGHKQVLPRVQPNEELTFLTRRVRSGATLGHAEIEVWRCGDGEDAVEVRAESAPAQPRTRPGLTRALLRPLRSPARRARSC